MTNETEPLNDAHSEVDDGARNRSAEFADELVEFAACWAYAEEEGYFDEEDYERACTVVSISLMCLRGRREMKGDVQANGTEHDESWSCEIEQIRYAQCKAKNHAKYAGPVYVSSATVLLPSACVYIKKTCGGWLQPHRPLRRAAIQLYRNRKAFGSRRSIQ